jgi:hypothetical protein
MVMRYYGGGLGHHDQTQQHADSVIQGDVYEDEEEPEPVDAELDTQQNTTASIPSTANGLEIGVDDIEGGDPEGAASQAAEDD